MQKYVHVHRIFNKILSQKRMLKFWNKPVQVWFASFYVYCWIIGNWIKVIVQISFPLQSNAEERLVMFDDVTTCGDVFLSVICSCTGTIYYTTFWQL